MKVESVRSADGTSIAFETTGKGPPLILIGGAFCDRRARAAGTPLAALLAARFAVTSYDRRGRGDSGDTPPWALERELEDLAALIAAAGGRASLFGMSSGGLLALDAAVRGLGVDRIVVYEAPVIQDAARAASLQRLAARIAEAAAADRRAEAAELFLIEAVQVPAPAVAAMRRAPAWVDREALAHTLSHDLDITARSPARMAEMASVRAPTLILDGGASAAWMREANRALADAIPGARHRTLEGQTHDVDPRLLAEALAEFLAP